MSFWNDLRYSLRRLAVSPGFTAAAIGTIALGVGLNVGVFSVVNGSLFRDLPVRDGHQVVRIQRLSNEFAGGFPNPLFTVNEYEALRDRSETLSVLAAHRSQRAILGGAAQRDSFGTIVSCNYFDFLRHLPARGRRLVADDCAPGANPVVVLGQDFWETAFESDPGIVGRSISLALSSSAGWETGVFDVVGIAAADAYVPGQDRSDFYVPYAAMAPLAVDETAADSTQLMLLGRFSEPVDVDGVQAELNVIADEFGSRPVQPNRELPVGATTTFVVERATEFSLANPDHVASAIGFAVPFGLILLLVCANVTNLMLARVTDRDREIAIRLSLGASRLRLIRHLLTESTLIALIGGAVGSLVAFLSFDAIAALLMSFIPDPAERFAINAVLDMRVLSVALMLSLGTGLLCGLAPALKLTRPDLNTAMKPASMASPGGRLQSALVGIQVAVCILLLAVTGLFLRDFYVANEGVDPGFAYDEVVAARILRSSGFSDEAGLQDRLLDGVRSLPGVESAAYASYVPWGDAPEIAVSRPGEDAVWANSLSVSPGYFQTLGNRIVRGRPFGDADASPGANAAIVSESMARYLWPGQDPVGQSVAVRSSFSEANGEDALLQVVGVSQDTQIERIGEATYVIHRPISVGTGTVGDYVMLVKSRATPVALTPRIRTIAGSLDSALDARVWTLDQSFAALRQQSLLIAMTTLSVSALAMILAAVGIFGVVSYVVQRRTREIGIYMALGAQARNVLGSVLRRTMRPIIIGAAAGIGSALAVAQLLREPLIVVSTLDPVALGGAASLVLIVAFFAVLVPASRGLNVDPMVTLRHE